MSAATDYGNSRLPPPRGNGLDHDPKEPWADPKPLAQVSQNAPYPLEVLPRVMREAITEYLGFGRQPPALVASSAVSVASLATQHIADVRRDALLRSPIGIFTLNVAESGERKTAADRAMGRGTIEGWCARRREGMRAELGARAARRSAWQETVEGLRTAIRREHSAKILSQERIDDLERRLAEACADPPPQPIELRLFFEDASSEALKAKLGTGWPSASLWSNEAAIVVGGRGMTEKAALGMFACINQFWDGSEISSDRRTAESYIAHGRRLTASLSLQAAVLSTMLSVGGGSARASGFMSRFLLCAPASTIGSRDYVDPPQHMPAREAFARRLEELLDVPLPTNAPDLALNPPVLDFDAEAKDHWVQYANAVERSQRKGGEFEELKDIASKSAEQASRLSAIFHLIERGPAGRDQPIGLPSIMAACRVAGWHVREALRLLVDSDVVEREQDARKVLEFVLSRGGTATRNLISQQIGSRQLRANTDRRNTAIGLLIECGLLRQVTGPALQAHPRAGEHL